MKYESTGISLRLDQAIRGAGLRNEDIAERLGTRGKGAVQHWRSGRNEPTYDDLRRVAAITGRSLYWLISGRPDPANPWQCLNDSLAAFRTGVAEGEEPVALWEKILERPLSEEERAALSADPDGLRDYLGTAAGEEWATLDPEEQAAVAQIVHLLLRNKREPPRSPEKTSE